MKPMLDSRWHVASYIVLYLTVASAEQQGQSLLGTNTHTHSYKSHTCHAAHFIPPRSLPPALQRMSYAMQHLSFLSHTSAQTAAAIYIHLGCNARAVAYIC